MRPFPVLTTALCLFALAIPAGKAVAQAPKTSEQGGIGSQPASVAEIVAATEDCVKFVKHHGQIDNDGLKKAGWQFGGKEDVKAGTGMPANTMVILGKGNVIMILRQTGLAATCQTVGRVADLALAADVRSGIAAALGAKPAKDYKGDDAFKASMVARIGPKALDDMLISDVARFTVAGSAKGETMIVSMIMVPRILD